MRVVSMTADHLVYSRVHKLYCYTEFADLFAHSYKMAADNYKINWSGEKDDSERKELFV